MSRINKSQLNILNNNPNINMFFGSWTNNIDILSKKYKESGTFKYIIIAHFLDSNYIESLYNTFPTDINNTQLWWSYKNPIEYKYACDKINLLPKNLELYFYLLSSNYVLNIMRKITGINGLKNDEYLHGAGLHLHPRNGRLGLHLDYKKQKRINIILYLNKKWQKEWNGYTELWNANVSKCIYKSNVIFNNAIIF